MTQPNIVTNIVTHTDDFMADKPMWKYPFGPWRRAPDEYGGRWWSVTPFTAGAPTPWKLYADPPSSRDAEVPEGFIAIFGKRPDPNDFRDRSNPSEAYRIANTDWENALRNFKQAGTPPNYEESDILTAQGVFRAFKMDEAHFYEGRYGWMARWPKSQTRRFETPAWTAIKNPGSAVATYQVSLLTDGILPLGPRHHFVPPQLWDSVAGRDGDSS